MRWCQPFDSVNHNNNIYTTYNRAVYTLYTIYSLYTIYMLFCILRGQRIVCRVRGGDDTSTSTSASMTGNVLSARRQARAYRQPFENRGRTIIRGWRWYRFCSKRYPRNTELTSLPKILFVSKISTQLVIDFFFVRLKKAYSLT